MRKIHLGDTRPTAEASFRILHTAATGGQGPGTLAGMRKLFRVQEALENISHAQEVEGLGSVRVLNEDKDCLILEDADFDTLKGRLFGSGIEWSPAAARHIVSVSERLDEAETVETRG